MTTLEEHARERAYFMHINQEYPKLSDKERYEKAYEIEKEFKILHDKWKKKGRRCGICNTHQFSRAFKCPCKIGPLCKDCLNGVVFNETYGIKYIIKRPYERCTIKCPYRCEYPLFVSPYITETQLFQNMTPLHLDNKLYVFNDCINPNCEGILNKNNECEICSTKVCTSCGDLSHDGDCDPKTVDKLKELILLSGYDVNKCPSCNTVIFKSSGCNTQFCWKCSNYFDWITGRHIGMSEYSGSNYYKEYKKQRLSYGKGRRIDG